VAVSGLWGSAATSTARGASWANEKIQRRVEHDLYYIENWSVLFDLPWALAKTKNAY
jgi:lipopolysaccharide/colanic/teichoic acid biosynthesis glycosyltransferase